MHTRLLVLIFLLHMRLLSLAQTSNDLKYRLKDVGSVSIAPSLEIISGKYKKMEDSAQAKLRSQFDYDVFDSRVVFQQKGLNDFKSSSFQTYVRIIIETYIGKSGEYDKLTSKLKLTPKELAELNSYNKAQIVASFKKQTVASMKLIDWLGTKVVSVNGKMAIQTSYTRQVNDTPIVKVETYDFYNNDRMHEVILSYRIADEATWKVVLARALSTFQITNIR